MGIDTRGNRNVQVVSRTAVPVDDIANAVVDRKKLDWICNRFPVTVEEVFECIDAVADRPADFKDGITLINRGDAEDIEIETVSVNDVVFFSMISYGHSIKPELLDFDVIYNVGLIRVIRDIYSDLAQDAEYFENSDLHNCVYNSLLREIGHIDPQLILSTIGDDY